MVIHFYTLLALASELSSRFRGTKVQEIFTQKKSELVLSLSGASGEDAGAICISIEPKAHYFYARSTFRRARRNSRDLFPSLAGAEFSSITVVPFDRVVLLKFEGDRTLVLHLYNSTTSNILLVDATSTIIEAFKVNKELRGTSLPAPRAPFDERLLREPERLTAALGRDPSLTLQSAMTKTMPFLGGLYAKEILFRAAIAPETTVALCTSDALQSIVRHANELTYELRHPDPRLYSRDGGNVIFSLVPLRSLGPPTAEKFASVNEAIHRVASRSIREKSSIDEKLRLHERISAELRKAEKARISIAADLEDGDRSAHYAMVGKLLMSNLSLLKKGMKAVRLEDANSTGGLHEIVLDAALTPVQNAERYFEKSKKAKVRRTESAERLKSADLSIGRLGALLGDLDACSTEEDTVEFKKANEAELRSMKLLVDETAKEAPPFRVFAVFGGYEVWVGKSSANNDLLTMKYAQPNDLWFHVRGASGSHTVLKVPRGTDSPPREAIRAAASIAVYYSKMRKAGNVPVAYCERKYVRKPKGVAAGAVTLEREEVIFVQPKLPS